MIFLKRIGMNIAPPWYYGYAGYDINRQERLMAIIPLHVFVRACLMAKQAWYWFQFYGFYEDCRNRDLQHARIYEDAFEQGKQYGRREADLRYRPLIAELEHSTRKLNEMSRMLEPVTNLLNAFQKE